MSGNQPQNDPTDSAADGLCPQCGKRLQQRAGSITGWVFGSGVCTCLRATGDDQPMSGTNQRQLQSYALPALGADFDVTELVGIGGMGAVYKVSDSAANVFAIKVLRADLAPDPHKREMFRREIESAQRLKHPNLVSIYGFGETTDKLPFAAMEYVNGKSLSQIITGEGFLELERALNLFVQIADGLSHAHSLGIVHLDLKPSNIIVAHDRWKEKARVVDFGISQVITGDSEQLSQAEEIVGSLPYMSPEQCRGEPADFRSDIYSFGCLMYEVLTGKSAFQAENPVKTIMRHLSELPRDIKPTLQRFDIPPDLIALIEHCLQQEQAARYQLMEELLKDLQSVQAGHAAIVAKQQDKARLTKPGINLTLRQRGLLAAIVLLPVLWVLYALSERDTVSQMIAIANGAALVMTLLFMLWAAIKSIKQIKKSRAKMMQAPYPVQSDRLMLASPSILLLALIIAVPIVVSSCFVMTLASIFCPNQIPMLDQLRSVTDMMQPALVLLLILLAGTFLVSIRSRRKYSLPKRPPTSTTSQRSGA
ncbi:MAG TPA: serine/threonine-protein kinase [Trichormus sp.]|jgi:serine/threonine protein kinase